MSFIRRNRRTWPYAANSTGRPRGSLNLGPLATRVLVFEAIGEARETFAGCLSQAMIEYLRDNTELESANPVDLSLFMMGKSAERTKPVVMFISTDKAARLEAYRAIKESGILGDFPGFDIGHMDLKAEYENFQPLADRKIPETGGLCDVAPRASPLLDKLGSEAIDDTPQQRLKESEKLNVDEKHPRVKKDRPTWTADRAEVFRGNVSWDGMLRLVQLPDESTSEISSATAGGILSYKGSYYLQSVNHFLEPRDGRQYASLPPKPTVVTADSAECEVAGLSDFDEDDEDDLANITSRGSGSPVSSHSETCDSETTEEDNPTFLSSRAFVDQTESLADTVQSSLKGLAAADDDCIQPPVPKYNSMMRKGNVVAVSHALDSSVIHIDLPLAGLHPELFTLSQLRVLVVPLENYETHIEMAARDAAINATTSGGGSIGGLLSGTPSFVRLAHSRAYRQVYVCKLHRPLAPGDCGAWVRDAVSGKVFGHIIAGSPTTGLAWVMPARDVFAHARSSLENLDSASKQLHDDCENGPNSPSQANEGSQPSSSDPSNSATPLNPSPPRKCLQRKRLTEDDGDTGDDGDSRRKRQAQQQVGGDDNCSRLLACPFWKLDPGKHRGCFHLKLLRISRVKQHLLRTHAPPWYCEFCLAILPSKEEHRRHVQGTGRDCSYHACDFDGITYDQKRRLSAKSKHSHSQSEQWFVIWDILFPGRPRPTSPYMDPGLSEDLCHFREHIQAHGPRILARELRARTFAAGSEVSEEEINRHMESVIAHGLNSMIDEWVGDSMRQLSGSPNSQSLGPSVQEETPSAPSDPPLQYSPLSLFTDSGIVVGSQQLSSNISQLDAPGGSETYQLDHRPTGLAQPLGRALSQVDVTHLSSTVDGALPYTFEDSPAWLEQSPDFQGLGASFFHDDELEAAAFLSGTRWA